MTNSFDARQTLAVNGKDYEIYNIQALADQFPVNKLPYAHKILLENLLRHEDGENVTKADIEALGQWNAKAAPKDEIAFTPSRVILQDFTGVPAVVDLAAMRDAIVKLGGKADSINPLSPAELVIDHSVQVDFFGIPNAFQRNAEIEFERNKERYSFLRWGQTALENFKVVPPDTGIVHQVNLEYLARVVFGTENNGTLQAYPDTLVGTDSHTTMVNGLGVLGWGVGGIEAEAAMLGQAITMLIPQVVGVKLKGQLPEGATATDLVLTVTEALRKLNVVGKFVEFFGDGLSNLPLADRATLGNMSPEFGSTCAIFPVDDETLRYMELSGRDAEQIELTKQYAKAQGLWRENGEEPANYSDILEVDLSTIEPSIAGPKRPQDRIPLKSAKSIIAQHTEGFVNERTEKQGKATSGAATVTADGKTFELKDDAVVIAAITSCTNTSNPAVMIAAGLLARNALKKGIDVKPWVKTSLAPGSKVVTDYLDKANLTTDLDQLGFGLVGYGCTTCIGNSGPLHEDISQAIQDNDLIACAALSGNRNFEGRIHPDVKMNFLASPPLVVAYALAGTMAIDMNNDALGEDKDGNPIYLKDIWPSSHEIQEVIAESIDSDMFKGGYEGVFEGNDDWKSLDVPEGAIYDWDDQSTYVQNPPYFEGMSRETDTVQDISGARVLALLGDSVTTDHISPAGAIAKNSPAGQYLLDNGVKRTQFNSYGSRRGNHEVMMRGTFANIRLRNLLAPGTEGGFTVHIPSGEQTSIYDAAMRYKEEKTPLIVIAGSEYGTGSSRDWAAKGTLLLGVEAVIATSFERIHRSNLIGMGVLPLQFADGDNAESLGLTGKEEFAIEGLDDGQAEQVTVRATADDGSEKTFKVDVRLDTPKERDYYRNGGILHYVLRQMAA